MARVHATPSELQSRLAVICGGQEKAHKVLAAMEAGYAKLKIEPNMNHLLETAFLRPESRMPSGECHRDDLLLNMKRDLQCTSREIIEKYAKAAKVELSPWPQYAA